MPETLRPHLPRPTAEQRRAASGQFERANQVLTTGNEDYAIQLLLSCCELDPINPVYRQTLRQAEKAKYQNNGHGQALAGMRSFATRLKMKGALRRGEHLQVLTLGEQILLRNPWDLGAHLAMAHAFTHVDLPELALWTLDQVRQVDPNNPKINRPMARLCEQRGQFSQAMALWELVRKADPHDLEAQHKHKDLAAHATIAKGRYEEAIAGEATTPATGETSETATDHPAAAAPTDTHLPAVDDRWARAIDGLRAKVDANPKAPQPYLELAGLYRRIERFDEASRVVREGLGPTGNHFELVMELADLEIEPFRRDLALTEAKLECDAEAAELHAIRARLVKEIHTRELDTFRRKAERFPTDVSYRFELGVRLFKLGQIDEAIKTLQTVRTDPRHQARALVYLGFCFKQRNNWRLAQRNFEEALKALSPAENSLRKELLFQLACGCADAGDLARAVDLACELANLDFGYKNIGTLLDDWTARLEKV